MNTALSRDYSADASKKILVIDDDLRLQSAVKAFFSPYKYEIHARPDGQNILHEVERINPDLILLDVMLPGEDGFSILQRLRGASSVPVLMLTARGEDVDRIVGLEMGADDYLAKPFNPRELMARIKAILRRAALPAQMVSQSFVGPADEPAQVTIRQGTRMPLGEFLHSGEISLDLTNQMLLRQGRNMALSVTEFQIMRVFLDNDGQTLTRDQLLSLAFGEEYYANDRLIDVHISHIRRILRDLGETSSPIRTVWGVGYKWIAGGE